MNKYTIKTATDRLLELLPERSFSISFEIWNHHRPVLKPTRNQESGEWCIWIGGHDRIKAEAPTLDAAMEQVEFHFRNIETDVKTSDAALSEMPATQNVTT